MTREEEKQLAKELDAKKCILHIMDYQKDEQSPLYDILSGSAWGINPEELILAYYPEEGKRCAKIRSFPTFSWDGTYKDNRSYDEMLKDIEKLIDSHYCIVECEEIQ